MRVGERDVDHRDIHVPRRRKRKMGIRYCFEETATTEIYTG